MLFSSSKDQKPNVWYSLNGERLGTYDGHQGAVWCLDVDWESRKLITGAGDMTTKIWDVEHGTVIASIAAKSSVRTCNFSFSGNQAAYSTDKAMGQNCELFIIDVRTADSSLSEQAPTLRIPMVESKITSMLWGPLDETIITGTRKIKEANVCQSNQRNLFQVMTMVTLPFGIFVRVKRWLILAPITLLASMTCS